MKKLILGALITLFTLNSCTEKKELFDGLSIYTGKDFNKNYFFNFLGNTEIIKTTDVNQFVSYRAQLINESMISNYKLPLDSMSVDELNKMADSINTREEVVFIFGLDSNKNLRPAIISSLGYPKDNKNIKAMAGKWLSNEKDSTNYINYRKSRILNKVQPYLNFVDYPFVSFSKKTLKNVIGKLTLQSEKWKNSTKLYFHYGYSKDSNGKYHVAILFTPLKDLSTANANDVGFANRGGVCCPPQ